ncbi:MAG: hypothetical protein OER90_15485 [Gemmatimonadota bacterium]|nr:hypothetical protein [Gemmatimonadota bacterium]
MRVQRSRTFLLSALGLMLGCGEATGPAVERNDPGTGTNTLSVVADIDGRDIPGGLATDMDVQLRDAQGAPVSGATITIRNGALGTTTLFETGVGTGDYTATVNNFGTGDYELNVVAGNDKVENVVVGGIGVHTIQSPTLADTVPANQPLIVTWSRSAQAFRADVDSREYEAQDVLDLGTHTIPAQDVRARSDERIRVDRYNEVTIAGGLAGSRLQLELRRTVEPIVVQ